MNDSREAAERNSGPLSRLPWWLLLAVGVALIVVGVAIHSSPFRRGGSVTLGVLLVLGSIGVFWRTRRL